MMYLLAAIFLLSSSLAPMLCGEKKDEIISFEMSVGRLNYNPLRYCEKKYIDFLNKNYGMQCDYNEPFLSVQRQGWVPEDEKYVKEKYIDPITLVPFKYFIKGDIVKQENDTFKEFAAVLFSVSGEINNQKKQLEIKLGSDFENFPPQELLNQFKKEPRCMPGQQMDENGKWFVDSTYLKEELCDAGIIYKVGEDHGYASYKQKYTQGINGYFGDEIQAKLKAELKAKKIILFCSRLEACFGGCLIAVIVAYVFYKKFLYNNVSST